MPAAKTPTPRKIRRAAPRPTVGWTPSEKPFPFSVAALRDSKTLSAHLCWGLFAPEIFYYYLYFGFDPKTKRMGHKTIIVLPFFSNSILIQKIPPIGLWPTMDKEYRFLMLKSQLKKWLIFLSQCLLSEVTLLYFYLESHFPSRILQFELGLWSVDQYWSHLDLLLRSQFHKEHSQIRKLGRILYDPSSLR